MDDDLFGSIVFTSHSRLGDPQEPEDCITEFSGKIHVSDEILNKDIEVGRIRGSIVECAKCLNYGFSLFDLFDASSEIDKYMSQVWDYDTMDYSKKINPSEEYLSDTLILEYLYIYPEFNGNGYGLAAIQRTIEHFSMRNNSLVVFEAYPLQFQKDIKDVDNFKKRMNLSKFEEDKNKAIKSLMEYYSSGGFKRIGKTSYMYKLEIGEIENLANGALK